MLTLIFVNETYLEMGVGSQKAMDERLQIPLGPLFEESAPLPSFQVKGFLVLNTFCAISV